MNSGRVTSGSFAAFRTEGGKAAKLRVGVVAGAKAFIDTNYPCSKNVNRLKLTQAVQRSNLSLLRFPKRKLKFEL